MITPDGARRKIEKHFEREYRRWAALLFLEVSGIVMTPGTTDQAASRKIVVAPDVACQDGSSSIDIKQDDTDREIRKKDVADRDVVEQGDKREEPPCLSIPLHPPTEKAALADIPATRSWVDSWRRSRLSPLIVWTEKCWKSIGKQQVPARLVLSNIQEVAQAAGQMPFWKRIEGRTLVLASKWKSTWQFSEDRCVPADPEALGLAIQKSVAEYGALNEDDWIRLLATLDWLMQNPAVVCHARQLPVRGIDSKWMERHKRAAEPLYSAMTGKTQLTFLGVPRHIRVRFLDDRLAPGGLRDIAVSPEELNTLTVEPRLVLVVENLVTLCCLPDIPGIIALHGGGYAVSTLSSVHWFMKAPVLYWGDLDSNGFAILNRLRHHHPQVTSLMMDAQTLESHRELCVVEESPNRGTLECLTAEEQEVLILLLSGKHALRLEQERIEWNYALEQLQTI